MKAIASITIDDEFVVHDIRVIDGNNGMFVAMPSKRTPDGEFRDIAHPISSATGRKSKLLFWKNMIVPQRWKKRRRSHGSWCIIKDFEAITERGPDGSLFFCPK